MADEFEISLKDKSGNPQRKALLPANTVIKLLQLNRGDFVVDIGCETSYISEPLASKVPCGRVYALDISLEMLEEVKSKIETQHIGNITSIFTSENHCPLERDSLVIAVLAMVFHEVNGKVKFSKAIERVVRTNGRVAIREWSKSLD
ncbi:MAG: methyltransferase domain-containing protein [Fusobacteria bacterium]|nr:methyltransferase domain-containing protein [Fusobacteriota bacterium]